MTLLAAIKAANADGDFPTSTDLADGLDRSPNSIRACLTGLKNDGKIESCGKVRRFHTSRVLHRWRARA